MRKGMRTLIVLFTVLAVFITSTAAASAATDKTYTIQLANGETATVEGHFETKVEKQIVTQLNKYRKSNKVSTVKTTKALEKAADTRAIEAAYKFSHTRPNGKKYNTVAKVVKGENLAQGYKTASAAMKAWKKSKSHNKNMLLKKYKTVGVSVFAEKQQSKSGRTVYIYYAVQNFGY